MLRMLPTVSVPRNVARRLALIGCVAVFAASASILQAQSGGATQVHDASVLHPPTGARAAIVEFDDLECPACAAANSLLKSTAAKYQIPWIHHELLIPSHVWSPRRQ
jgi:protein-disulfide isomerase